MDSLGEQMKDAVEKINPRDVDIIWLDNHIKIVSAWEELYNKFGKRPTYVQLAEHLQLSKSTVANHLRKVSYELDVAPRHILNLDKALDMLFKKAVEDGNVKALVEYIKLIGNPTVKKEINQNTTNRTLKVTFINPKDNPLENKSVEDIQDIEYTEEEK